jgi:hypothetical protein
MREDQVSAFWSKVKIAKDKKSCWEWSGAKKRKGYGNVRVDGKYLSAHRVAFELANGSIPIGYMVCHVCDNPPCCNPRHLMLGTAKSNACDMLIKNRQKTPHTAARGEGNGMAKLSEEKAREIRRLYAGKLKNQYELAEMFGVSQVAIGAVVRMETWRHV